MAWGSVAPRWRIALAILCALELAPALGQTPRPPAPAQAGYLGGELHSLSRREAKTRGVPGDGGAAIAKVDAGSPAAAAGLKNGDILLEIDGKLVTGAAQVFKYAASKVPGTVVKLRVLRHGKVRAGSLKLGAKPGSDVASGETASGAKPGSEAANGEPARKLDEATPAIDALRPVQPPEAPAPSEFAAIETQVRQLYQ